MKKAKLMEHKVSYKSGYKDLSSADCRITLTYRPKGNLFIETHPRLITYIVPRKQSFFIGLHFLKFWLLGRI